MNQTRLGHWGTRLRLLQGLFFPKVAAHGHCSEWVGFRCRMIPQPKHIMVCHHTSNHVKCTSPRSKTLITIWRDYLVYLKKPPLQVQQYMFLPMGEVATGKQHTYKTQKSQVCQNFGGRIQVQLRSRYFDWQWKCSAYMLHTTFYMAFRALAKVQNGLANARLQLQYWAFQDIASRLQLGVDRGHWDLYLKQKTGWCTTTPENNLADACQLLKMQSLKNFKKKGLEHCYARITWCSVETLLQLRIYKTHPEAYLIWCVIWVVLSFQGKEMQYTKRMNIGSSKLTKISPSFHLRWAVVMNQEPMSIV